MKETPDPIDKISFSDKISEEIPKSDSTGSSNEEQFAKWLDNNGNEVKNVFGFNLNAELVNGRAAMFGFIMLILTELAFGSQPVTKTLFGLG
tara:strand:+ start:1055 stop:1330 length:276 start_codon:yes stop_codon:yes gene_type:complete